MMPSSPPPGVNEPPATPIERRLAALSAAHHTPRPSSVADELHLLRLLCQLTDYETGADDDARAGGIEAPGPDLASDLQDARVS